MGFLSVLRLRSDFRVGHVCGLNAMRGQVSSGRSCSIGSCQAEQPPPIPPKTVEGNSKGCKETEKRWHPVGF